MAGILFSSLLILFALGVPVAFSMGLASIFAMMDSGISLQVVIQRVFSSLDSFPLMAIPFFILAGNIMEYSGISQRLINLANSIVGRMTGGLGMVTVLTAMFFASISGSSAATTAAIGSILIPAMVKRGFPKPFSTSVQAVSGELGVIIPPSIPMIIFALSAGTAISIGDLFLAGIGPGLLISLSLMLVIYLVSKRNGYGQLVLSAEEQEAEAKMMSWQGRWDALRKAVLPLMMPVIILGGIYGGIFTPTEAAAVAVGYALVLGLFVYRTINQTKMMEILRSSVLSTSVIMLIIGNAGLLGWVLTAEKVPSLVANWFVSISDSPIVFLLLVNLLLLLVGMFLETGASIVIIAPILTPVAMQFGIDPIHFGIIIIVNLAVGMVTPPIGVNLFVACQIAGLRIEQIMKSMLPFYLILIIDILLVTYLPQITLWLPSILK
ncbi:TRAP transporter large permease [Brevibacillus invocatus]|uniref:TRAP transporter large permease n=1 Tax=Brevibacillus invocatus TaxID=173959 RepID=A0A3M8CBT3_9BACL|nr:TRAP transporter large permease [Brevibacillus invocatus]MCM3080213.1 TRAP transporter large permease [Brevibacillus invocatus]MCM3430341.1 TRAP transporter large permease [Brevibacillus invocatus]RNB73180.1 TRAP transporter large permease [Brevibacillus invocatus]